ncbi:hypothetical protein H5410_054798 [Solanum commersonii]|uniref:Uncharacterized protein n=1 Tax=Solanum commersonii TaxID=4109 RepID=A0A9J5WI54_SOLCO|nr:hypothetical protein H5410_054798 [Solanum commersonii]
MASNSNDLMVDVGYARECSWLWKYKLIFLDNEEEVVELGNVSVVVVFVDWDGVMAL